MAIERVAGFSVAIAACIFLFSLSLLLQLVWGCCHGLGIYIGIECHSVGLQSADTGPKCGCGHINSVVWATCVYMVVRALGHRCM